MTEGEVFKDEALAGTERTNNPTNEVPEPHDHGKNLNETSPAELISKSLILQMYDVLMTHRDEKTFADLVCGSGVGVR